MAFVKRTAKKIGVTVNDLLIGAVATAYHKVSEPGQAPPLISIDIPI